VYVCGSSTRSSIIWTWDTTWQLKVSNRTKMKMEVPIRTMANRTNADKVFEDKCMDLSELNVPNSFVQLVWWYRNSTSHVFCRRVLNAGKLAARYHSFTFKGTTMASSLQKCKHERPGPLGLWRKSHDQDTDNISYSLYNISGVHTFNWFPYS
jgi:hypothetical protein